MIADNLQRKMDSDNRETLMMKGIRHHHLLDEENDLINRKKMISKHCELVKSSHMLSIKRELK